MNILKKYADLLATYCLEVRKGEKIYIASTTLGEPLVREVYREILRLGAFPETDLSFEGRQRVFLENASPQQLDHISPISKMVIDTFDAFLYIRAPYNLKEEHNANPEARKRRTRATKEINEVLSKRTASGEMRRTLCQFPTRAAAQEANMSLEEYEQFVFNACHLYDKDPSQSWKKIREEQQMVVDMLNAKKHIRYQTEKTDIAFSVQDRIWINSDGRVNMPSGEVFTGPVEDSVEGVVHFDYPSIFFGKEVSGVTFEVRKGRIEKWSAERGGEVLDEIMSIDGARYFGEAAIGTNYNIQRPTKNILFDEKIGGTIHMAVGQSYMQTGGKNKSSVHWDLISDMTRDGRILADGEVIYENGKFI